MADDRIQYNEPGNWLGPDYALWLVDEIVATDVTAHLEMKDDNHAYLAIYREDQTLFARIYARPTTRTERRQILTHNDDRLRDQLNTLTPLTRRGRLFNWCGTPLWRRPAIAIQDWWNARQAARAVLCIRITENELIPE